MNHGGAGVPVITPEGEGKYLVTELGLFMPGHWQLRTTVSGPVMDHVVADFDVQ